MSFRLFCSAFSTELSFCLPGVVHANRQISLLIVIWLFVILHWFGWSCSLHSSFTDRKGDCVGTFETNQNKRISTDGTTYYRHYEVSIQSSNPTSFSSTNPPKTSLSANLLNRTGRKRRLRNTTTWRTESQNSPLLRFWSRLPMPGWKVIAHYPHYIGTSEEDHWRNSHRLRNHCTEMLPKDLP